MTLRPIIVHGPCDMSEPCNNCDGTDESCGDCFGRGLVVVTLLQGATATFYADGPILIDLEKQRG